MAQQHLKNVADAINKAADAAKAGAAWNLTTNSSTTDKTSVQGGDTVDLINGDNILITQDGTDKKENHCSYEEKNLNSLMAQIASHLPHLSHNGGPCFSRRE